MKIDHIVFDIGNVLLDWDPNLIYMDLIPNAEERKKFLDEVCTPKWNIEQDRGRAWKEAEDLLIEDHPEKAHLIRAFRKNWIKSIPHAHEDVAALMTRLVDDGHDVTLLSNFNQETYQLIAEKYSFFAKPRGATVSGEVKLIKPDSDIYEYHNSNFLLQTENTVFIDNSPTNIEAAQKYGWQTILFEGFEGAGALAARLANFGISV